MKQLLLTLSLCMAASACFGATEGEQFALPGTGISMRVPSGMALDTVGPILVHPSEPLSISFTVLPRKASLESIPLWVGAIGVFRGPPERTVSPMPGNLYRRTRDGDGEDWDGWLLSVPIDEGRLLTVLIQYAGKQPDLFDSLKPYLLTLSWRDVPLDPEKAMGISLDPTGLKLVRDQITLNALSYNESGRTERPGKLQGLALTVTNVGSMLEGDDEPAFRERCRELAVRETKAYAFVGGPVVARTDHLYCEGWNPDLASGLMYMAIARNKAGAQLLVLGNGPATAGEADLQAMRDAVAHLRFTR